MRGAGLPGGIGVALIAQGFVHHRVQVLAEVVSQLFARARDPSADAVGVVFVQTPEGYRLEVLGVFNGHAEPKSEPQPDAAS